MSGVVRRRNSPDSGDSPAWIAPWDLPTRLSVTRRRPSIRPCTNFLHSHDMPPVTPPSENSLFHPLWRSREPRNFIYIVSPLGTHFRRAIIGVLERAAVRNGCWADQIRYYWVLRCPGELPCPGQKQKGHPQTSVELRRYPRLSSPCVSETRICATNSVTVCLLSRECRKQWRPTA